jgi:hypothetical protein
MNAKNTPTQHPIPNTPALGKYKVTYPTNMQVIPVIMRTEFIKSLGTPGKKITALSTNINMKNAASPPTNNKVILYKYIPNVIKITPNINVLKKNAKV